MGRPRKDIAQIGGGNPAVVAGPGYRQVPPCKFKLKTEKGAKEYGTLARKLFDAGKLNEEAHFNASCVARIVDNIEDLETSGKTARASWFTELRTYRRELGLNDLDKPIAAPSEAAVNKFARIGLPNGC